ncbi:ATP-binding protein [Algoriphagus litoralis]|uniref:ATP-binding protein n=1 Tax=Algoriphagus litoralis TaxID=2202829 RepID=UPI0018E52770|nr:ATP-binding protein [Algoriphagus litoralis]
MKDPKRTKLILRLSLIVSFLILTVIFVVTLEQFRSIPGSHGQVVNSFKIQDKLQQLYILVLEAENAQHSFLLTKKNPYLISYQEKKTATKPILDSLAQAILPENPKRKHFQKLDSLITLNFNYLDKKLSSDSTNSQVEFLLEEIGSDTSLIEEIKKLSDGLKNTENYETGLQLLENQQKSSIHLFYLLLEILFSLGVFTTAYIILEKNLKKLEAANRDLEIQNTIYKQVEKISNAGHWYYKMGDEKLHFSINFFELLGYKHDQVQPDFKMAIRHIHKADRPLLISTLRKILETEDTFTIELRLLHQSGVFRTFRMMVCLMNNEFFQKIAIGAVHDVTEQLESSSKLERLFSDLKIQNNIFKNAEILAGTGSYSYHHDSGKTEFSDNLYRIFGYKTNGFTPTADHILKATDLVDQSKSYTDQDLIRLIEQQCDKQIKISLPGGNFAFLTCKTKRIVIGEEHISIITFKNISDEISIRNRLEENNTELTQTVRELDSFNHIASHDLQEPLRKIQTFVSRILSEDQSGRDSKETDYLIRIQTAADRMRKLINDLLSLTRIVKGEKVSSIVSLNQLLEESIKDLTPDLLEKKSVVSYTILPEADVIPFQIRQLFDNLISNSLKYSKSTEPLRLEIDSQKITKKEIERFNLSNPKEYFKIAFIDNGIGFDKIYADSIFSPFKRLHDRSEYSGTGIGLSICKKVMENHKGFIYATSEVGQGACFYLIFPRKQQNT